MSDTGCAYLIMADEYIFSTYFAAMMQGMKVDDDDDDAIRFLTILQDEIPGFEPQVIDYASMDLAYQERMMKIVDNLRSQFNEQITSTYVRDFLTASSIYRQINNAEKDTTKASKMASRIVARMIKFILDKTKGTLSISFNLQRLKTVVGFTDPELALIELSWLFSIDVRILIFRELLFSINRNSTTINYIYETMLGDHASDALSKNSLPNVLGITSYDRKHMSLRKLSEFWVHVVGEYSESDEKFFEKFFEPLDQKKKNFSGAIAKITNDNDEVIFTEFLKTSVKNRSNLLKVTSGEIKGMNVLLYGSPRLNKLGYITEKLTSLEFEGYQVKTEEARNNDIPSMTYVTQRWFHEAYWGKNVILVVGKAEAALTKQNTMPSWLAELFSNDDTKRSVEEDLESDEILLLKNTIPTIWLTNACSSITPENVGKFLFHCELKGGSRKDRREEVEKVVAELGFSTDLSQHLSKYLELSVEQIRSATRLVNQLGYTEDVGEQNLIHLIGNSQRALDREKMEEMRSSVTKYSLDLLNINGNMKVEKIIQALKKKATGTLCFFGLPGTGKTQLAEYIALQLDLPLIIKPASELLDKYVGGTEKNIAEAFEEARSAGAVFLLDEADSFLRDRSMSEHSWEVTQVNELLQRMERYPGIFICATNLFDRIDAAALRRFTFKLEFRALTEHQRIQMIANECNLDLESMSHAELENLAIDMSMINNLTPGDFATVKRQAILLDETLTLQEWIDRLKVEVKAKLVGIQRNIHSYNPVVTQEQI